MVINLHVWSSIAGYGSRKRCWLGDQKCGLFRMVVRAHLELISSISFFDFFVMRPSAMLGSCSFDFIMTFLSVALDVGMLALQRAGYSRNGRLSGTCVQQIQGTLKVHVFTGAFGGRSTDIFGGLVGWNCKVKMAE